MRRLSTRAQSPSSRAPAANAHISSRADVTMIMGLLADIQQDVSAIRWLMEDSDGEEEEAPEADG